MAKAVAVVGASSDRGKYGNKSVRAHRDAGWKVYPVNPKGGEIEGLPAYARVADIPEPLDRITVYVPPEAGRTMLEEFAAAQPGEVFFNPGSWDDDVAAAAKGLGLRAVEGCSIIDLGVSPEDYPAR